MYGHIIIRVQGSDLSTYIVNSHLNNQEFIRTKSIEPSTILTVYDNCWKLTWLSCDNKRVDLQRSTIYAAYTCTTSSMSRALHWKSMHVTFPTVIPCSILSFARVRLSYYTLDISQRWILNVHHAIIKFVEPAHAAGRDTFRERSSELQRHCGHLGTYSLREEVPPASWTTGHVV